MGAIRPVSRAGLLELARSLDALCRVAPLGRDALAELQRLARAADAERDDPDWRPLHDRLARLAPLLLGGPPPLLPLYRSGAPPPPKRAQHPSRARGAGHPRRLSPTGCPPAGHPELSRPSPPRGPDSPWGGRWRAR